jgi:hypothetical protein
MWVALALIACTLPEEACVKSTSAAADAPPACADICAELEAQFDCCTAEYGFGGFREGNLQELTDNCTGDACDPDQYVSERAAYCLAYGRGLGDGFSRYNAVFYLSSDSAWFVVENPEMAEGECVPGTLVDRSADIMQIDARTGEQGGVGTSSSVGECT